MKFQYYKGGLKKCRPLGWVHLESVVQAIREPKHDFNLLFDAIDAAETKDQKQALKIRLPYFTPAVQIKDWRAGENITQFTGLMPIDIDDIPTEKAIQYRDELFKIPETICAWLSTRKNGTRAIIRIPEVETIEQYKAFYNGFTHRFSQYPFDNALASPVLPMFLSRDSGIKYREGAEVWEDVFIKPKKKVMFSSVPIDGGALEERRVKAYYTKAFARIVSNGHPQLMSICLGIGNQVGAGWISESAAQEFVSKMIQSNEYLANANPFRVYFKSACEAISYGMGYPQGLD